MDENLNFDAEFRIRLPSALAEKIAEAAQKERRSRNLQYVYMLENWFDIKGRLEEQIKNLEGVVDLEINAEKEKGRRKLRSNLI